MTTELGLSITDIKIGDGAEVKKGSLIICHYEGKLQNGVTFDSSLNKGKPFQAVIGTGRVIKGWDIGLMGMKAGGIRTLSVPAKLAYGERQIGEIIPPHSHLNFHIELLEVKNRDD